MPFTETEIGESACYEYTNLTQINIPEGVTEIGYAAFYSCINLTKINIPEGMTKIETWGFRGDRWLTQINIPKGATEIGEFAFNNCSRLTQITIPKSVTKIGRDAFNECTCLTQINIPDSVTKISDYAFRGCSSLTQINIPQGLIEMGEHVFKDCANLQRILESNNNDVVRVKSYLPDELKDKVTGYYLQHQQNINKIRHSQLVLSSSERLLNVFHSFLINRDVTRLIYLFLSFQDIIRLSCIYTGVKPIKDIAQSIQRVRYEGIIPGIKPTSAVKTSFLEQYTPNKNNKELTDYHRSLNQYKLNLRKNISVALSESNNKNEKENDSRIWWRLLSKIKF